MVVGVVVVVVVILILAAAKTISSSTSRPGVGHYFIHEKQKILWVAGPKGLTQFCIILIVFLY